MAEQPQRKKMRVECFAAHKAGQALTPWQYDIEPAPGPGEVDVEITHCGVCHSDVHQLDDAWGVACWPLVPGHEIAGKIIAVGAGVSNFKIGDGAAIGVQRSNCGSCRCCDAKLENVCPKILKTYAGPGKDKGGFARHIRYPSKWVFKCPPMLEPEFAGPLMCAGITVFSPLKRFVLNSPGGARGKKVGIIGIGGLGHLALQFASRMGARVVAISRTNAKEAEARGFGAHEFLASKSVDDMKGAAGTFDMLLNTVSGNAGLDEYFALLKPRGSMACVGLPEKTEKSQMFLHSLVLQERTFCGSYLGPYGDYQEMLDFACQHDVRPMIERYPFEKVNEAIERVRDNTARYRCVLYMQEDPGEPNAKM